MAESRRVLYVVLAASAIGWALALTLAPLLAGVAEPLIGLLYAAGSLVCHQRPERSFHVAGSQLPVCARCLGLYLGGAAGTIGWALMPPGSRRLWTRRGALVALAAGGAPTALSVASAWIGAGDPPNDWRALMAVPLGAAAGVIVGAVSTNHLK